MDDQLGEYQYQFFGDEKHFPGCIIIIIIIIIPRPPPPPPPPNFLFSQCFGLQETWCVLVLFGSSYI